MDHSGNNSIDVGTTKIQPLWFNCDWAGELPGSLQQQLKKPRQIPVLVAHRDEVIIGWVSLVDRSNTLQELYVEPGHRRQGVGTRLFRCLVSLMLDYGAAAINLQPELSDDSLAGHFLANIYTGGNRGQTPIKLIGVCPLFLKSWMSASQRQIHVIQKSLGIPSTYGISRGLRLQQDADELTGIGIDCWQRPQQMLPRAAAAWSLMQHSAANDNVTLLPVSAFRSTNYQARLIKRKLEAGQEIESILQVSAAPGFSEHHSGRAIDITDGICAPLENEFAASKAFQWLKFNAEDFGFDMSYPQDNPHGIIWEPWHWCWSAAST